MGCKGRKRMMQVSKFCEIGLMRKRKRLKLNKWQRSERRGNMKKRRGLDD